LKCASKLKFEKNNKHCIHHIIVAGQVKFEVLTRNSNNFAQASECMAVTLPKINLGLILDSVGITRKIVS